MDQADPNVFVSQLETMIAFADAQEDHVLGAWLSEALSRMNAVTGITRGLPSVTE